MKYYRITAPHFCACVGFNEDREVCFAAPILRYMRGWRRLKVRRYCRAKRWEIYKFEV
jgi:hypothetical protein